jgi:Concanavalin A-like lectin/glucanases superfamily
MKKFLLMLMVLAVMGFAVPVSAAYYLAGEFNGWTPDGQLMTDNLDGTYSATVSGMTADSRYEFKVTNGTWDESYPGSNAWLISDGSGEVEIMFDTNIVSDGWTPDQYRISLNTDPGTWNVVGELNGWNNNDPSLAMTSLGGGIYKLTESFSAGTYLWKIVNPGTWDAIGANGRGVDASNMEVTATAGVPITFYVNALNGTLGSGDIYVDSANPDPANGEIDVPIDALTLSWDVARDPTDPNAADPDLLSHELYMTTATDPNLVYVDAVASWGPVTLRAEYTLVSPLIPLSRDAQYFWRVKEIRTSGNVDKNIWTFDTERSIPVITVQAGYQVVEATTGTADFTITVTSVFTESYQWYKVDAAGDITLSNGGDISGATTNSLSIINPELADEGAYYCVVTSQAGAAVSDDALLGIKREIANWSFESGSRQSDVAGSPGTRAQGDPAFVTGNVGDGMSFDGDDLLYVDPNFASYFDICNYTMTVSCWVKCSSAGTWSPLVSRYGDSGEGWQFRHNGGTLDKISFTTRGTGNDDGTPSDETVFDGNWHYATATYDGTEKKVYIDGVLDVTDTASGLINSTLSPVAMAGRVVDSAGVWTFEGFMACVLDDVSIYNYAQDAATIAQTYADITQTNVCPEHPTYDLNGNCKVDLPDLALLAQEWLLDNTVYFN